MWLAAVLVPLTLVNACTPSARWEPPPAQLLIPPSVVSPAGSPSATAAGDPHPSQPSVDKHAIQRRRAGERLALGRDRNSLWLDEGRWVVAVHAPARSFVTIGVAGPRGALTGFEVAGRDALTRIETGTRDDDGLLPSFVSFETGEAAAELMVVVDVKRRARLLRSAADRVAPREPGARALRPGRTKKHPLVGMPFPLDSRAGYQLQTPSRYGFVRADVAAALRGALRQTRIRFRRNSIFIGDASQWNGRRPAMDLDRPRHISHDGGRDVDIGLPADDDSASLLKRRCDGVLVEKDVLKCGPGTVSQLDAKRLAYFLGLLIDGPTPGGRHIGAAKRRPGPIAVVETIFTDQAYIDEIRKVLPALRRKRWIHDEAFGALGEDGLLRPSSWHVDHVHVRFRGGAGKVPAALQFKAEAAQQEPKP
jgi:hypothetical protein